MHPRASRDLQRERLTDAPRRLQVDGPGLQPAGPAGSTPAPVIPQWRRLPRDAGRRTYRRGGWNHRRPARHRAAGQLASANIETSCPPMVSQRLRSRLADISAANVPRLRASARHRGNWSGSAKWSTSPSWPPARTRSTVMTLAIVLSSGSTAPTRGAVCTPPRVAVDAPAQSQRDLRLTATGPVVGSPSVLLDRWIRVRAAGNVAWRIDPDCSTTDPGLTSSCSDRTAPLITNGFVVGIAGLTPAPRPAAGISSSMRRGNLVIDHGGDIRGRHDPELVAQYVRHDRGRE